jgi:4-amino-4-deoxy-L-arabinose transferase-like glycosyltransferase
VILATYAKGPYALFQIAMIVGLSIIWEAAQTPNPWKNFINQVLKLKPLMLLLIVFPISISWYLHQSWLYGDRFIGQVLGYFGWHRIFGVVQAQTGPIYYYVFVILLFAFPWTFIIPHALNELRKNINKDFSWRFMTICLLSTFIFFSLAGTKLPNYILLMFPFLAMSIALAWQELKKISWLEYLLLGFQCLILIYGFWLLMIERQRALSPQMISLVQVFLLVLLILTVVLIFYLKFSDKNRRYLVHVLGLFFLLGVFTFILPATNPLKHSRSTMLWLKPLVTNEDLIFEADPTPSFIFYLNHSLRKYDNFQIIDQALKGPQRVFVIFRDNHFQDNYQKSLKSKYYVLKQEDMITIISNRNIK